MKKATIIGSGIGGLSSAIRLSVKRYAVDVYEANNSYGGKMRETKKNGFRFDMGPSLLTMPEKIDELFLLANKNPRDYFQYTKLEEGCRYFYDDKTVIRGYTDVDKFANELHEKAGVSQKITKSHIKKNTFIFDSTSFLFLEKSLHKLKTYLSFKVFIAFLKLPFLQIFQSMHSANSRRFKSKKAIKIFNRFATYNGSNPYKAPAILNSISALEFNKGAFYPNSGMFTIATALYKLAIDLGVKFHFNTLVEKISVNDGVADGVFVLNNFHKADIVICNQDIYFVYKNLLPKKFTIKRILNQERSSSALIFYWGIKKEFPNLQLHNILFSNNYEEEFKMLSGNKEIYKDPTIYINITSKMTKNDAPDNCENWFVMINTPNDVGQNWQDLIINSRKNIIKKINKVLDVSVEEYISCEEILTPKLIERSTQSFGGSLYGSSSNARGSAFFRHPNFSNQIVNLYFCGGSVHPGGGIPLALSSSKIIGELIS